MMGAKGRRDELRSQGTALNGARAQGRECLASFPLLQLSGAEDGMTETLHRDLYPRNNMSVNTEHSLLSKIASQAN